MLFTVETSMTFYQTAKITAAVLLALQLSGSLTGENGSMLAVNAPAQYSMPATVSDALLGHLGWPRSVSFSTLLYEAYP
jgi:hypothetical protein